MTSGKLFLSWSFFDWDAMGFFFVCFENRLNFKTGERACHCTLYVLYWHLTFNYTSDVLYVGDFEALYAYPPQNKKYLLLQIYLTSLLLFTNLLYFLLNPWTCIRILRQQYVILGGSHIDKIVIAFGFRRKSW